MSTSEFWRTQTFSPERFVLIGLCLEGSLTLVDSLLSSPMRSREMEAKTERAEHAIISQVYFFSLLKIGEIFDYFQFS